MSNEISVQNQIVIVGPYHVKSIIPLGRRLIIKSEHIKNILLIIAGGYIFSPLHIILPRSPTKALITKQQANLISKQPHTPIKHATASKIQHSKGILLQRIMFYIDA
jgi:hypothetical protein